MKLNIKIQKIGKSKRAQMTAEYAILITVIVAALFTMQTYMKRALAAHLKDAADYPINVTGTNFTTGQYEPDYYYSDSRSAQDSDRHERMDLGGGVKASTTTISSINMTEMINGTS
jgi:hypothetical protein